MSEINASPEHIRKLLGLPDAPPQKIEVAPPKPLEAEVEELATEAKEPEKDKTPDTFEVEPQIYEQIKLQNQKLKLALERIAVEESIIDFTVHATKYKRGYLECIKDELIARAVFAAKIVDGHSFEDSIAEAIEASGSQAMPKALRG